MLITKKNQKYYLTINESFYEVTPFMVSKYKTLVIDDKLTKDIQDEIYCDCVKNEGLKILSRSAKTSFELSEKLKSLGFDETVVLTVIQKLQTLKVLDDLSYANSFVQNKISSYGKKMLTLKLRSKGLSEQVIKQSLKEIDESVVLVKKIPIKLKAVTGSIRVVKEKVHHYFYQKGYDSQLINELINKYLPNLNLDPIVELCKVFKKVQVRFNGYQTSLKLKNKLIKYLLSKGYSIEDVLDVIENERKAMY